MYNKFGKRNLLRLITKVVSLSLVALMLVGMLGACKKNDSKKEASASPSSTAAKTTAKASATPSASKTPSSSATTSAEPSATPDSSAKPEGTESPTSTSSGSEDSTVAPVETQEPVETEEVEQTTPPEEANTPEESGSGPVEEVSFDLGGRKVIIGDWNVTDLEIARLASNAEGATEQQKAGYQSLKYQEQKYNCDIEFMKYKKGSNDFVQAALAGQHFADAFFTSREFVFPRVVNMGLIIPIDDYIDFENDPLWVNTNPDAHLWRGKHYGLRGQVQYPYQGTWINYDIIERTGVEDPYDLWQAGNWNWETMLDIALQVTDDTDGDGVTDQWGINNSNVRYFLYSNGGQVVEYNEATGRYEYALDKPNNRRAMQFWADLSFVHKVVGPGYFETFAEGNFAFMFNQLWNGQRIYEGGVTNLGWIPFPNGPDVPSDYITNVRGDMFFLAFPSTLPENERAQIVKVVADFLCLWDPSKPYYFPDEKVIDVYMDTNYAMGKFRDWNYVAAKTIAMDNETMIGGESRDLQKLLDNDCFNPIANGEKSVVTALESVKAAATDIVNTRQDLAE